MSIRKCFDYKSIIRNFAERKQVLILWNMLFIASTCIYFTSYLDVSLSAVPLDMYNNTFIYLRYFANFQSQ